MKNDIMKQLDSELALEQGLRGVCLQKMMPQRIFKQEQTLTRKYDIEQTLCFEPGDGGLPREADPLLKPPSTLIFPSPCKGDSNMRCEASSPPA